MFWSHVLVIDVDTASRKSYYLVVAVQHGSLFLQGNDNVLTIPGKIVIVVYNHPPFFLSIFAGFPFYLKVPKPTLMATSALLK